MKTLPHVAAAFAILFVCGFTSPHPAAMFTNAQDAQQHCSNDSVVWLNLPTGIFHFRGSRWYGATRHGAFVCEKEAVMAGDRRSHHGE